jgi:hypothetical protein
MYAVPPKVNTLKGIQEQTVELRSRQNFTTLAPRVELNVKRKDVEVSAFRV